MKQTASVFITLVILALLAACQSPVPVFDIQKAVEQTVEVGLIEATETSRQLTLSVSPTKHETPAQTASATLTSPPTQKPTKTPTLSPSPSATYTVEPTDEATPVPYYGIPILPRASFHHGHIAKRQSFCAEEGVNLSCESEYRRDSRGCYVGMTCYDACGWYYSVNTIPDDVGAEYGSGPCW